MKKALKLHKGHFRVGRPLPWDVYDSSDHLLLSRGYVIDKEAQLEALLERGMYVDAADLEASIEKPKASHEEFDPFWIWDDLTAKLAFHLTHADSPEHFPQRTEEMAGMVQALIQRNADAAIAIIMLTADHRRYPSVHSLQVAALGEILGKRLGWEKERRTTLLCAALTMNLGMLELQQQLSNQREPLNQEQRKLVRGHPQRSLDLLRQSGVESAQWLAAVEAHHETTQGTGYPGGICNPSEDALLLRTLDVFCAKVSPRLYRKPLSGTQAERILFSDAGLTTGNPFVPALIKELGVYPPGSFVKLANGEIAIVLKRMSDIKTPQVMSLINTRGEPMIEPIRRDTSRDGFQITGDVRRDTVHIGIDPAHFWQEKNSAATERRQWG